MASRNAHARWMIIAVLSCLLILFTLPHGFEDVTHGEPARFGVSQGVFAVGLALAYAAQGLALYWLGLGRRIGLWAHLALGFGWGIAAIVAHVPEALAPGPYRSGVLSLADLLGMIVIGLSLGAASASALRRRPVLSNDRD
jgi:hypothetical protein